MYKILIDTRERYKKSVKLTQSGKVISVRKGDLDIAAAIKDVLKENNLKIGDVDEFYAHPGPGSFTGLRIGAATANVLNWVLGRKRLDELMEPNYAADPNIFIKKC